MRHPAPPRPGARRASCSVSRCPRAAGAGACAGAGAPTWKVLWISSGVKLTYFILADSRLPGPTQLCLGLSTANSGGPRGGLVRRQNRFSTRNTLFQYQGLRPYLRTSAADAFELSSNCECRRTQLRTRRTAWRKPSPQATGEQRLAAAAAGESVGAAAAAAAAAAAGAVRASGHTIRQGTADGLQRRRLRRTG